MKELTSMAVGMVVGMVVITIITMIVSIPWAKEIGYNKGYADAIVVYLPRKDFTLGEKLLLKQELRYKIEELNASAGDAADTEGESQ